MIISMIACMGERGELGHNNQLLVHNREDFKWFRTHTMNKTCVFGRKTYESLKGKTLKGRNIIVLTKDKNYNPHPDVLVRHSVEDIIHEFQNEWELLICGGEQIYKLFLPYSNRLYITRVHRKFNNVDSWFPTISSDYREYYFKESRDGLTPMTFHVYKKTLK